MQFAHKTQLILIVIVFVLLTVLFVSPVAKFIETGNDNLGNPSFEDIDGTLNWVFDRGIDDSLKHARDNFWSSHGDWSMRIYGNEIIEKDHYVSVMQIFDIPSDVTTLSADVKIVSQSRGNGGYKLILCSIGQESSIENVGNAVYDGVEYNCEYSPRRNQLPMNTAGEHTLSIPIPESFRGEKAAVILRAYYKSGDVVDGYWDNVVIG